MATLNHLQRLFAKPKNAMRNMLLLGATALLLLTLAPPAMAGGKGGSSHGKSGQHYGKYRSGHHHARSYSRYRVGIGFPGYYYGYGPYRYGYGRYGYYGHYGRYGRYGHYRHYPYGYGGYSGYGYRQNDGFGALDLNVKPKDTQVWVNGGYVGTTGKLDGSPSMLWLEQDSYEVIFFKEGYTTEVRKYTVTPGGVIKERFEMSPGEAKRPEELSTATPLPRPSLDDSSKKDRDRRVIERRVRERRSSKQERKGTLDVRKEPGQLAVHVTPKDASVYLDGDFIGTAKSLRKNPVLLIDPGKHRVEIVHPGYESKKVEITVEAGKAGEVEVNLMKKQRADV